MSDLRAACDRLRINDYPDSHDTADGYVSELREADLWTVANEYLSTHPADGAEPIDEAWLLSQGFEYCTVTGGWGEWRKGVIAVDKWPSGDWRVFAVNGGVSVKLAEYQTRSQLRGLLAALGVV
jgi:hypothetical protein